MAFETTAANDHCGGQCSDILPPGQNGNATLAQILLNQAFGAVCEAPSAAHGPTGAHAGSSFQYGWWSYVDKDIRAVLGESVQGPLARKYCGGGSLSACRDVLISTLKEAAGKTVAQVYPGDDLCSAGAQWCADSIVQRTLGGIKQKNQLAEPARLPAGGGVHVSPVNTLNTGENR